MDNAFKIKKGLIVNASGSTAVDIQGNSGQLFSITDSLTGVLMSVNDVSGLPILEVSDTNRVKMGTFGAEGLIVEGSDVILPNTDNSPGDILTIDGNNKLGRRTAAQVKTDIGVIDYEWILKDDPSDAGVSVVSGDGVVFRGINGITTARGTGAGGKEIVIDGSGVPSGTVTSITAGDGLSGGTITTTGTIDVDASVVRTSGDQTLSGTKTFSSAIVANAGVTRAGTLDLNTTGNNDIVLSTNGNERLRITGNGRTGIGTSTPTHILHIGNTPRIDSTGSQPDVNDFPGTEQVFGSSETIMGEPDIWLRININGVDYVVPAYQE